MVNTTVGLPHTTIVAPSLCALAENQPAAPQAIAEHANLEEIEAKTVPGAVEFAQLPALRWNRGCVVDEIFALYEARGSHAYCGEAVSELEHALQTAEAARAANAPAALIAAALLHDIGHLLSQAPGHAMHEHVGADWLAHYFLPSVSEPVRLHVMAKRYLCAADRGYVDQLSSAARLSLAAQGGPLTLPEAESFRQLPHARAALRLRWWDERARTPRRKVFGLGQYRSLLVSLLREP